MAKMLAFKRAGRQVVLVDTVAGAVTDLGNDLLIAETTSLFPNRCENLVCVFRGDVYVLYLATTGNITLALYNYGTNTWADVAPAQFPPFTTATGVLTPLCLHVADGRMVAVVQRSGSVGIDGILARRSAQNDPTTWDANVAQGFAVQPTDSSGGPSIVWHNALFVTSAEGIVYYDVVANTLSTFDPGDDTAIVGQKANFGSFAFWNYDLYYALPTDVPAGSPSLYKLDRTWTTATPTPTFQKQTIVIPAVGNITIADDTGNYSLFASKTGEMCLIYSGATETKLVRISRPGASYQVDDITQLVLSEAIRSEPSLGFGYYVDDRRSTNEQHIIIVRFRPSIPVAIILLNWDGAEAAELIATLDDGGAGLDLMVPDEERGNLRTYTGDEPSCDINSTTQPYPGRVEISYTVRDRLSRSVDITPEFSLDGQSWTSMTQGDGGDPVLDLTALSTGSTYTFNWDAFIDLVGDVEHADIRIVARVSGV